ncbi:hypothetical protein ACQ858_13650 [Variovorax ureilyticus]|uniref:hypothetical protein n=1 Tax=Variovorax ureilyticus TaxID=1836198 RepID=UPI003D6791D8
MEATAETTNLSSRWAAEDAGLTLANQEFEQLRSQHREWFNRFEDLNSLDRVTRPELAELASCAPRGFARGLMYSLLAMRVAIDNAQMHRKT